MGLHENYDLCSDVKKGGIGGKDGKFKGQRDVVECVASASVNRRAST